MSTNVFAVADDLYCLWAHPDDSHNVDFLRGIDAEYFKWIANLTTSDIDASAERTESNRAATLARLSLHQGIETFFSLVGCLIQAPTAAHAWLAKCRTETLREIVAQISESTFSYPHRLTEGSPSWQRIATISLEKANLDDVAKKAACVGFAELWERLATDFVDPGAAQEYNSLKHGFRVAPGGFSMKISHKDNDGVDKEFELGGSKHGVSYYDIRRIGGDSKGNRSIRAYQEHRNWDIKQTALLLVLVSMSIRNLLSVLQLINKAEGNEVQFAVPSEDEFSAPWRDQMGMISMNMQRNLPDGYVKATSKDELSKYLPKTVKE